MNVTQFTLSGTSRRDAAKRVETNNPTKRTPNWTPPRQVAGISAPRI